MTSLAESITRVRERIAGAMSRAGRNAADVRLVAVTKTIEPAIVRQAHELGLDTFGENRARELAEKVGAAPDASWHMIGHLQQNKARFVVPLVTTVESVDSPALLQRIERLCGELHRTLDVLLEVNVSGEPQKHGVPPAQLDALLQAATACAHLRVTGLMTVATFTDDARLLRGEFGRLRDLRDRLAPRYGGAVRLRELSMGMSHDFELAIAEGATIVRIGTAIFGARDHAPLPA